MNTATAQSSLVYELDSILRPINLSRLFAREQPLEVELGCGDGSFLVDYAAANPDRNFIGIERLLGRIRKLDRKGHRGSLTNLRGIRIESAYFLEYLLPGASTSAVHLYFPDPWPKRKHRRHRLVNERFPELCRRALKPRGMVYLRTDDRDYFEQMEAVFEKTPGFVPEQTPLELSVVLTDFEREFNARGIATLRAAYRVD
jgi:tRNA (guanine-N7-)-methyltransferase